jgi:glycosyltransferase involved in cell wall biosynthesis
LGSFVRFAGQVDDTERRRLLSESFVVVVPSLHEELFGMVAVEGALSGLPVIASAIGGLQEIVEHGRTGFLFPAGNAGALARHLRTLIADPAASRRMGTAGRAKALLHYTIEHTADSYEHIYASAIRRQRE